MEHDFLWPLAVVIIALYVLFGWIAWLLLKLITPPTPGHRRPICGHGMPESVGLEVEEYEG